MKYKEIQYSLNRHYDDMCFQADIFIVQEAKKLMELHPLLNKFCIAMGTWCFYDENRKPIDEEDYAYIRNSNLAKFIHEWDDYLKLTGNPIKIENGKVLRDW